MAYASQYYDPVKAHEYYMKHRKLKGRKSTSGLNDTGKEAAKYVKEKLTNEKKQAIESMKTLVNAQADSVKAKIEQIRNEKKERSERLKQEQERINQLSERIRNMEPGPARDRARAELKKKREAIKGKRAENKAKNEKLRTEIAGMREGIKKLRTAFTDYKKKMKEHYDNKYIQELDRIKGDKNMRKV